MRMFDDELVAAMVGRDCVKKKKKVEENNKKESALMRVEIFLKASWAGHSKQAESGVSIFFE